MDKLETFCDWFLREMPVLGMVPARNAVDRFEQVTSLLLYRNAPFQVQMFLTEKEFIVPEHTHPNVDSIEVYLGGDIKFSHGGKFVGRDKWVRGESGIPAPPAGLGMEEGRLGTSHRRGMMIRVRPNDVHGGLTGKGGGAFLSVQHWLNDLKPHCISNDWSGIAMGTDHRDNVVDGDVEFRPTILAADAASRE